MLGNIAMGMIGRVNSMITENIRIMIDNT